MRQVPFSRTGGLRRGLPGPGQGIGRSGGVHDVALDVLDLLAELVRLGGGHAAALRGQGVPEGGQDLEAGGGGHHGPLLHAVLHVYAPDGDEYVPLHGLGPGGDRDAVQVGRARARPLSRRQQVGAQDRDHGLFAQGVEPHDLLACAVPQGGEGQLQLHVVVAAGGADDHPGAPYEFVFHLAADDPVHGITSFRVEIRVKIALS